MAKPQIKGSKENNKTYIMLAIIGFIFFMFFGLHYIRSGYPILAEIELFTNHMSEHPFDLFPVPVSDFFVLLFLYSLFVVYLHVEFLRRKRVRYTDEHGSAAWNSDYQSFYKQYTDTNEIIFLKENGKFSKFINNLLRKTLNRSVKINTAPGNKNMLFSENVAMSIDQRKHRHNCNVLLVGGAGSGKTRFNVKPNLLQANCSYVITDPSGEILKSTGHFLREQGYDIKVFNLSDMAHSHRYNPFAYIRDEQGVLTMINVLISNTTDKTATKADPFWEKAEQALLSAICLYLFYECNEDDRHFANVMKLLLCAEVREDQEDYKSTLDIMFEDLEKKNPEHIAVSMYKIFKQAAGKTAKSILITCTTRLQIFKMQRIANLTRVDDLDLTHIGDKKTALFCITPVGDLSYNFLVAMVYSQLFQTLYHHAETTRAEHDFRLKHHVRFLLDEFANIGTIPDFQEKLATCRKYEISCTIILQNINQLKAMYEKEWQSIAGNCDTFEFLGGNEQDTFEYVSKMLGKETIETQTDSRNFGKDKGGSRSKQIVGRELMLPEEVGMMDNQDCVIKIRGVEPFYDKKYDYPKHPNYHLTGDANPKFIFDVKKEVILDEGQKFNHRANRYRKKLNEVKRNQHKRDEEYIPARNRSVRGTPLNKVMKMEEYVTDMSEEGIEELNNSLRHIEANDVVYDDLSYSEYDVPNMFDDALLSPQEE